MQRDFRNMNFLMQQRYAVVFLRVVVAMFMVTHGVTRISLGIVDDFGGFFETIGIAYGLYLAWAITIFEIVAGLLLAAGFRVKILAALFIAELATGIALVHAKEGWFVVGAGRNGAEFSILLIAALIVIAYAHYGMPENRRR